MSTCSICIAIFSRVTEFILPYIKYSSRKETRNNTMFGTILLYFNFICLKLLIAKIENNQKIKNISPGDISVPIPKIFILRSSLGVKSQSKVDKTIAVKAQRISIAISTIINFLIGVDQTWHITFGSYWPFGFRSINFLNRQKVI